MFPDKLRVSLFLDRFHTNFISPYQLYWVKDVCVFRCNLPPAHLLDWLGSFACHCGNTGVEQTPNNSQHTKSTLEKKNLLPLLPGFKLATFQSGVQRFTNKLSWLPGMLLAWRFTLCSTLGGKLGTGCLVLYMRTKWACQQVPCESGCAHKQIFQFSPLTDWVVEGDMREANDLRTAGS